jgi:hypothetical protein
MNIARNNNSKYIEGKTDWVEFTHHETKASTEHHKTTTGKTRRKPTEPHGM